MTTIGVTFDGSDYSDYVFSADIWRDTLAGVGRWEVLMDPLAQYWGQLPDFTPGNPVEITIDLSTMMEGIVDDPDPYLEGVETDLWRLSGRDWGWEMAERFYTAPKGDYVNLRADDIINRVFTATGVAITPPVAPFTAPFINYEWKPRTYLGDGVRDIADKIGYDFYVADNDPIRTLFFFAQGAAAQHTGVNLDLIPNSLLNNILKFDMGERQGSKIKNNIVVSAGNLKDHYTDLNAGAWTPRFGTAVTNNTNIFVEGKGSLQALSTRNNNAVGITLDFTAGLYGYTSFDLSEPCMGRYAYLCHYPIYFPTPGLGTKRCHLQLEDVNGEQIRFYRSITAGFARNSDATQTGYNDFWQIVDKIQFGEQNIEPVFGGASTKGYWWYFSAAAVPFDWTQVTKITFNTGSFPIHAGDYFLVDSLMIPTLEVISTPQTVASLASIAAYGQRDKDFYRPDIRNQVELDAESAAILPTLITPLEKLSITAIGQVISDYAGQSLDVTATQFGVGTLITPARYRIAQLHHMIRRSSQESEVPGWDFLTEYELIRNDLTAGGTQYYDSQRFLDSVDARQGAFNKTRLQQTQRTRGRVNLG